jgi:inorganic triphosphatase YgiF
LRELELIMEEKASGQAAAGQASAMTVAPDAAAPPREIEVKFRSSAGQSKAVRQSPLLSEGRASPARELVTTYFDTAGKDLRRNGLMLRLRRKGRASPVLGVKWQSPSDEGLFARGEVEVRCPDGLPAIERFDPAIRERLAAVLEGKPLQPVFETRTKRYTTVFRYGHSDIELAVDDGAITAGDARLPLCDIELELKSGNSVDLLNCASNLARDCELSLEFEAKSDRGYRLVEAAQLKAQKAAALALPETVTFDDLLAAVITSTLNHFVANWAALRETEAPESVHQLRVALRRMRSALGIFRRVIALPELEDIRAEARRIASALGPARECDAFRQNALSGPFSDQLEHIRGAPLLLEAVAKRRQESYAAARRVIDDPAASLFVLRVQGFVLTRAWRTALAPQDLGLLTTPGKFYAASVLDRLLKRVLKRGKHMPEMPDEERHEVRIALKNFRYASEFFGSLFANGKGLRNDLALVADLQEDLGAHNDAATAKSFIESLELPPEPGTHFATGYLLGWYRHATMVADGHLKKKWKTFKRADVFWE